MTRWIWERIWRWNLWLASHYWAQKLYVLTKTNPQLGKEVMIKVGELLKQHTKKQADKPKLGKDF